MCHTVHTMCINISSVFLKVQGLLEGCCPLVTKGSSSHVGGWTRVPTAIQRSKEHVMLIYMTIKCYLMNVVHLNRNLNTELFISSIIVVKIWFSAIVWLLCAWKWPKENDHFHAACYSIHFVQYLMCRCLKCAILQLTNNSQDYVQSTDLY